MPMTAIKQEKIIFWQYPSTGSARSLLDRLYIGFNRYGEVVYYSHSSGMTRYLQEVIADVQFPHDFPKDSLFSNRKGTIVYIFSKNGNSSLALTGSASLNSNVIKGWIPDELLKCLKKASKFEDVKQEIDEFIMKSKIKLKTAEEITPAPAFLMKIPEQPPGFFLADEVWKRLVFMLDKKKQVLLTGPSGCGKTESVSHVAKALGYEVVKFNFGGITDAKSGVLGTTQYAPEKGTYFVESLFLQSLRKPKTVILLDELTRATPDVFNLILTLLDRQRYITVDDQLPPIKVDVHEDVVFWATANEGSQYTGTTAMDLALKDRFQAVIRCNFPSVDIERKILASRSPGCPPTIIQKAVEVAKTQREQYADAKFNQHISTRVLIEVAETVSAGFSLKEAFLLHVGDRFSLEGAEQSEFTLFTQVLDKHHVK